MEWVNISKTFKGTRPDPNSFIAVFDGFTLQLYREHHQGSWTLTGWGNGIHVEPTNMLTKDAKEAQMKAKTKIQDLLKDKMNFLVKLMNEIHMNALVIHRDADLPVENKEIETKTH